MTSVPGSTEILATSAPGAAPQWAQYELDAYQCQQRIFDAGQVGISLVRGLGSGLPCSDDRTDRRRFRQAAIAPTRRTVVHAPEWTTPGIRGEFQQCESARSRVGRLAGVPELIANNGARATRTIQAI